jgi:polyisoprenyl-phosphate glycosyltransferase
MLISIVIPVYQAESIIEELLRRLSASLSFANNEYEIILVDDGSTDNSWAAIEKNSNLYKNITGIKLSRNFGQHHAITAGIDFCKGDWVVVMDCDLQDRPEAIIELFNKTQQGYDIVLVRRINRKDGWFKKIQSQFFYTVFGYLTGIKHDGSIGNFGIYSRNVISNIKKMREPMRAFSPMVQWVGFSKAYIDVEHDARYAGKSSYNFRKVAALASDIIVSYSDKPLRLIIRLGFLLSLSALFIGSYYFVRYLNGKIEVSGYTSIILSIWFLGGLIILNLGILGLYIGKIFSGIKNRPLYIIDKTTLS